MNFEHIIWVQVLLGLYLEELKKKIIARNGPFAFLGNYACYIHQQWE